MTDVQEQQLALLAAGRALIVGLEPGLDHSRVVGIFSNINQVPGVKFVADVSIISRETLDLLLLSPAETVKRK